MQEFAMTQGEKGVHRGTISIGSLLYGVPAKVPPYKILVRYATSHITLQRSFLL